MQFDDSLDEIQSKIYQLRISLLADDKRRSIEAVMAIRHLASDLVFKISEQQQKEAEYYETQQCTAGGNK